MIIIKSYGDWRIHLVPHLDGAEQTRPRRNKISSALRFLTLRSPNIGLNPMIKETEGMLCLRQTI